MHLSFDLSALLIVLPVVAAGLFYFWKTPASPPPTLFYPSLSGFSKETTSSKNKIVKLLPNFQWLAWILLAIAFLDIHWESTLEETGKHPPLANEGVALYFLLDLSGSMGASVIEKDKSGQDVGFITKLDLLKKVTKEFIAKRPSDLIGLIGFARIPEILSPLTADHEAILEQLQKMTVVIDPEQNATAIGYAIYKATSVMAATRQFSDLKNKRGSIPYDVKSGAVILVTDGFQSIYPDDKDNPRRAMGIEQAAQFAKENKVKLYIVSIDPLIRDDEYAPQRRLMQKAADETGGKYFTATDPSELSGIYSAINQLEPSVIAQPLGASDSLRIRGISFEPLFITCALVLLAFCWVLQCTVVRQVP